MKMTTSTTKQPSTWTREMFISEHMRSVLDDNSESLSHVIYVIYYTINAPNGMKYGAFLCFSIIRVLNFVFLSLSILWRTMAMGHSRLCGTKMAKTMCVKLGTPVHGALTAKCYLNPPKGKKKSPEASSFV